MYIKTTIISKSNHMNGTKTKSTVSTLTNSDETTFILAQLLRVHLALKLSQKFISARSCQKEVYIFLCFFKLCLLTLNLQKYHLSWWLLRYINLPPVSLRSLATYLKCLLYCEARHTPSRIYPNQNNFKTIKTISPTQVEARKQWLKNLPQLSISKGRGVVIRRRVMAQQAMMVEKQPSKQFFCWKCTKID